MSATWDPDQPGDPVTIGPVGWLLVALRGTALALLVFGGLALLLLVRLIERPLCGLHRPVTPYITQIVCRNAFRILGMGFRSSGALMTEHGAVVANHSSWLDIFALNARKRIYFVSKSEVAAWPGIGWLARATGTVFIERDPRRARDQAALFEARLAAGHDICVERGNLLGAGLLAGEAKQITFDPVQPDPHRLVLVKRVVAELHEIEDPRPGIGLVFRVAVPAEHRCGGGKAGVVRPVDHAPHRAVAPRPFADREVEALVEQIRIDEAAEEMADSLGYGLRRQFAMPHENRRVPAFPIGQKCVEKILAVLEIPVEG